MEYIKTLDSIIGFHERNGMFNCAEDLKKIRELLVYQLEPPVMPEIAEEDIKYIVCEILANESGDGHVDGADTIADFIINAKDNKEIKWIKDYIKDKKETIWLEKYR